MDKPRGDSYTKLVRRDRCRHRWGAWSSAQLPLGHERRDCTICGWIQTRRRPQTEDMRYVSTAR
jgi:hypothetical protein